MKAHDLAEALRGYLRDQIGHEQARISYLTVDDSQKFDVTALCKIGAPDIELTLFGVDLIYEGIFRLPFESIYMEVSFALPGENGGVVILGLIAYQTTIDDDSIIVIDAYWNTKTHGWSSVGGIALILVPKNPIERPEDKGKFFSDGRVLRINILDKEASQSDQETITTNMLRCVDILVGSIAGIESKSTALRTEKAPDKLNKKREKAGKIPLYEHRIVTLCGPVSSSDQHDIRIGNRTSPRMHWRRGHLRLLSTGRRVPVSPSLVGLSENGVISHEYRARRISSNARTSS